MTIAQQALTAMQPPPGAPAAAWILRISACWQASVKAILEVGRLLTEAKQVLPHGEFGGMCESDLPFTARTAQMLMAIAADPRITNAKHISLLPASWGTLYELTKLSDEQFERGVAEKTIRPDMERKDAPRAHMAGRITGADDLDYSPTPPWATRALMEHVLPHLGCRMEGGVREPACGEGHIAEVLREYCETVTATDIHDYGYQDELVDFLATDFNFGADWVVTNPPFEDRVLKFILRALQVARIGVAMFLQLRYLEGVGRYNELFKHRPPTLVALFVERVPLLMGQYDPKASTTTAFMWIVWIQGATPRAPYWIPPGRRDALTKPDDAARFTAHPVIKRAHLPPHDPDTGEVIETEATPIPESGVSDDRANTNSASLDQNPGGTQ